MVKNSTDDYMFECETVHELVFGLERCHTYAGAGIDLFEPF